MVSLVLRERIEAFEEKLKSFQFDWEVQDHFPHGSWGAEMKEREWRLLIEAEQIGTEAVMLFRKYQCGSVV